MGRIQDFLQQLEQTMAAAAFAEAGEHESARQFLNEFKDGRKKVLLGTDHMEPDLKIVNYALSLCRRMGAGLEIFHVVPSALCGKSVDVVALAAGDPAFAAFNKKMAALGVAYQPVCSDRGLVREILDHVAAHRQVMCVVVSPAHAAETSQAKRDGRTIGEWFQELSCPVLFYSNLHKV